MVIFLIAIINLISICNGYTIESDSIKLHSDYKIYEQSELETISDNHDSDDKNEECFDHIKI